MSISHPLLNRRTRSVGAGLAGILLAAAAQTAAMPHADAVTATKIELKGGQLRVEGKAGPGGSRVVAESTTSFASVRGGVDGTYRIAASGFTAPDCYLTIRDGVTPTITAAIPGCRPSVTPVPASPAPPSGNCVITPQPPATRPVGSQEGFWFYASGCNPGGPLGYRIVAGAIPTGMSVGTYQNSTSGNLLGSPSIRGTYRFTVEVTDAAGATDQENFTINVT